MRLKTIVCAFILSMGIMACNHESEDEELFDTEPDSVVQNCGQSATNFANNCAALGGTYSGCSQGQTTMVCACAGGPAGLITAKTTCK